MKHCDCNNHYLELKHCDGENFISKRVCYKCGKWWSPFNESPLTEESTYDCYKSLGGNAQIYKVTTYPNYSVLTTATMHNGDICYLSDTREFVMAIDGTIMYIK